MGKPKPRFRPKPSKQQSCKGKQRFATLAEADAAAYRPRAMVRASGFMKGYACRFCAHYHYGHPPTKR